MAEVTQFAFEMREITEVLIKHQDLHEGHWMLGVELGFAAGMVGPSPTEVRPGAIVQINKFVLQRPPQGASLDAQFIVDASKINPSK